jgi:hypothetical protein
MSQDLIKISEACRSETQLIVADQNGLFSRIIVDLGAKTHTIVDKDGEQRMDVMIADMKPSKEGNTCQVKALLNVNHGFETGDSLVLSEVVGLNNETDQNKHSVNGSTFKVLDVLSP